MFTTNSTDAFCGRCRFTAARVHPLADACDFARHCSAIDFWAITDHAEASTPKRWQDAKQSIRACNAVADGAKDPDLVSFVGFEWTQVGQTPDGHYGHKNVIFRDLEDTKIAKRPIASGGVTVRALRTQGKDLVPLALPVLDFSNRKEYFDIRRFLQNALHVDESLADRESDLDLTGVGVEGQNFAADEFSEFAVGRDGSVLGEIAHYAALPIMSWAPRRDINCARFFSDGSSGCPCWAKKPTVTKNITST